MLQSPSYIFILTSPLVANEVLVTICPSSSAAGDEPSSSALCSSGPSLKLNLLNGRGESSPVAELTRLAAMESGDEIEGYVDDELPVYCLSRMLAAA